MMPLDELMKLMRATPLEKIEGYFKELLNSCENEDTLAGVTMRCFYRATCKMYEVVQPPIKLQICKILSTNLSDIPPGTTGRVLKEMVNEEGYAVEISGLFKNPHKLLSDATEQTRTFFFKYSEVEILPDEPASVCSNVS